MGQVVRAYNNYASDVIEFPTNKLTKYLENYDITKNTFDYNITSSAEEMVLRRYHDDKYERAAILTAEELYVGRTFDNLDIIKDVINKSKSR